MTASFVFKYVDVAQLGSLAAAHDLLFLDLNRRHNPSAFLEHLERCPDLSDDFPFFFYVLHNDAVIASVKTIPDTLYYGKETYRWGWTGDLYTDPAYRGQGVASYLWENMTLIFQQRNIFIAAAFANTVSAHIFRKMGYAFTDNAHRLLFFKNCRAFLDAHSKYKLLNRSIDQLYRAVVFCLKPFLHRTDHLLESAYHVQALDFADPKACSLFDHLQYAEPFHFNASMSRLLWKLSNAPHCTPYAVIEKSSNTPLAYFILKNRYIKHNYAGRYTNFRLMTLMDFGARSKNHSDTDAWVYFLIKSFWDSDAEVLEAISSRPCLIDRLKHKGFVKAGRGADFFYKAPLQQELPAGSMQIENWHFTHFASDAYSFL